MTAVANLDELLRSLQPELSEEVFVFVTLPGADYGEHRNLQPVASIREEEGLTLVVPRELAERSGLAFDGAFRRLTLQVVSDLNAVGLTAAISTALAESGISANVVAGFHHDHVFVPKARADEAMEVLGRLNREIEPVDVGRFSD